MTDYDKRVSKIPDNLLSFFDRYDSEYDPLEIYENKKSKKRNKKKPKSHIETKPEQKHFNLQLKKVSPLTKNQELTFEQYSLNKNLILQGYPGVGKTWLSVYLALNEILNENSSKTQLVIVRSAVPTRNQGFLPGSLEMKNEVYELPYIEICTELFNRSDAYNTLKTKGFINFISSSYLRGINLNDSIVLVDEFQNMNFHELDSIITRLGKNSKIIFSGDYNQSDLTLQNEREGVHKFLKIIEKISEFSMINFLAEDIVRSGLVKSYIMKKFELGLI